MSKGIENIARMLSSRLAVKDLVEAPEKFTDEEIGIIKQYHPTDIDLDSKGVPQEAFWYILQDKANGYACNIRFGKRYVEETKKYSWFVLVQGRNTQGKYEFEELSPSMDLPMNIEMGVTLLKKYLDSYSLTEAVNVTKKEDKEDNSKYKKELEVLQKIVSRAWNFLHEAGQEFKFTEINDTITDLERKFPDKKSQIQRLEKNMNKIRQYHMQFTDAYYQMKSEVSKILK